MRFQFFGCLALAVACASAGTVSGFATAENAFDVYVSTDNALPGTWFGAASDWSTSHLVNALPLTGGVTNYLHIKASNWGGPAGFLGTFTLDTPMFQFLNGAQTLNTDITNWQFSSSGFNGVYTAPGDYGANGVGPWGTIAGISGSAHWIWDPANGEAATAYFSTAIVPTDPTPEPGTFALFGIAAALAVVYRRRAARQ